MTKLWLMHCACLEHPALFFKGMELVSDERRKKVNHAKKELSKRQMLGAGILLSYALDSRGLKEQNLGYRVTPSGKPYFETAPELFFSLSHSGEWALCALGDAPVGADVQQITEYLPRVAKRCFSPEEAACLEAMLPGRERDTAFTRLWAARESQVKLLGDWSAGAKLPPVRNYDVSEEICIAACGWDEQWSDDVIRVSFS